MNNNWPKEREVNNLTFLRGYFALIFHFENAHYININRSFKVKTKTKLSLSRMSIYLFRVPKLSQSKALFDLITNFLYSFFYKMSKQAFNQYLQTVYASYI